MSPFLMLGLDFTTSSADLFRYMSKIFLCMLVGCGVVGAGESVVVDVFAVGIPCGGVENFVYAVVAIGFLSICRLSVFTGFDGVWNGFDGDVIVSWVLSWLVTHLVVCKAGRYREYYQAGFKWHNRIFASVLVASLSSSHVAPAVTLLSVNFPILVLVFTGGGSWCTVDVVSVFGMVLFCVSYFQIIGWRTFVEAVLVSMLIRMLLCSVVMLVWAGRVAGRFGRLVVVVRSDGMRGLRWLGAGSGDGVIDQRYSHLRGVDGSDQRFSVASDTCVGGTSCGCQVVLPEEAWEWYQNLFDRSAVCADRFVLRGIFVNSDAQHPDVTRARRKYALYGDVMLRYYYIETTYGSSMAVRDISSFVTTRFMNKNMTKVIRRLPFYQSFIRKDRTHRMPSDACGTVFEACLGYAGGKICDARGRNAMMSRVVGLLDAHYGMSYVEDSAEG